MAIDKKCVVEFNGKDIDPSRIDNPRLKAVFQERVHDGEKFLFRYGDHTDRDRNRSYSDYSDYSDRYDDHVDHKDRHNDYTSPNAAYSEFDGIGEMNGHRDVHTDVRR